MQCRGNSRFPLLDGCSFNVHGKLCKVTGGSPQLEACLMNLNQLQIEVLNGFNTIFCRQDVQES